MPQQYSRLVGPDGQPISLGSLVEDEDLGGVVGVRQVFHDSVARGMTPARLADVLERATRGDAWDYLTIAEEMEERDAHYAALLSVRKRSVAGVPRAVEPASTSAIHKQHADFIAEQIRLPAFAEMVIDLLDALGKGYSVCRIRWDRGRQWRAREFPHLDPRWFRFDRLNGRDLRILSQDAPTDGLPLEAFKYIVHQPRIKTGLQVRSGLARLCAVMWICKAYAIKDWTAFCEVFGLPLRIGRWGPNATNEDKAILKRAVASIGTDAAAVMPDSMKLEFHQLGNVTGGAELYERLCKFADLQMSKAVLGQTGTTDAQAGGLGSGQANVFNEVREDIKVADAFDLQVTLNRDFVKPAIDLNFGPQEQYPLLKIQEAEPEDLEKLGKTLQVFIPFGLRVSEQTILDKFGLPTPKDGERVLMAPSPASASLPIAMNAQQPRTDQDELDELVQSGLDEWQQQVDPILQAVQTLAQGVDTVDELLAQLPSVLADVEPSKLVRSMAEAALKARGQADSSKQGGAS